MMDVSFSFETVCEVGFIFKDPLQGDAQIRGVAHIYNAFGDLAEVNTICKYVGCDGTPFTGFVSRSRNAYLDRVTARRMSLHCYLKRRRRTGPLRRQSKRDLQLHRFGTVI